MTKKAQDVLSDNSHAVLYKIAQSVDFKLPAYVEAGVPLEKEAAASTNDSLFADEVNRRFPLTDKANTWLSGAYFAKTAADAYTPPEYRHVATRILKAASLYGITNDVVDIMDHINTETLKQAAAEIEKEAEAAESCYGEPETDGFPMFNEEQVKLACSYFDNNAYAYDWRRRANIAKNILRKTAEYGLLPSETVRKEAGAGFPRRDFLAENLLTRESELERRGLHKLAGDMRRTIKIVLEADPSELMGQLEPLREMVSGSDELSGIDSLYGQRFLPPADFIFDIGDDEARRFQEDTIPMCGELLSAQALSGLPRKLFETVMSPSMVEGMFENGRMSPKKVSVTIIKMKPREQHYLLDTIRDFTSGGMGGLEGLIPEGSIIDMPTEESDQQDQSEDQGEKSKDSKKSEKSEKSKN